MFPVDIKKLKAEEGTPFPLFLFLKKNDRFIPIRLPGDALGLQKYEAFLKREHYELWVPNQFQEIFQTYFHYLEQQGQKTPELSEVASGAVSPNVGSKEPTAKSEEAKLIKDALEDEDLSREEKAEVLVAVSQDLLRALNQITTRGDAARTEGLKRCKEVADEILRVAAQDSNIYDEILALRNSQEDIEHSVIVGTVATMFGLALGLSDEQLLADLTVGAIFHDIGLVKVKPEILAKPEAKWTAAERQEYEKHVDASVVILKDSGTEFHPRVFRMVLEHHENYDGSGFPKGLKGVAIEETSQLLHLANLFDRLCTGKQTGQEQSPAEAFDYIYEIAQKPGAVQEIRPELVQRIFQFMLSEKAAADELLIKAEARVEKTLKTTL
jgi:HD-GYP domain-containing protein (c-di-GMP phosphodiesterase class II)